MGKSGERGSGISVLVARQDDEMMTIYILVLLKEIIHECIPTDRNVQIFSHEQAVCGRGTKRKKASLIRVVPLSSPGRVRSNDSTVQSTEAKEFKNGFLKPTP